MNDVLYSYDRSVRVHIGRICREPAAAVAEAIWESGFEDRGDSGVMDADAPTAGMNNSETEHAIALIRKVTEGKTLVMVEHDMGVVFSLADRISVLVYGQIIASDTPKRIRENPAVREASGA
jgi:branched-chain amino acid transport system ATP-binding protein